MLALGLSKQTEKRLESFARRTGRTRSCYAGLAIQEFLDDREDCRIAAKRPQRHPQGIPLEEVERRLGLKS
ncbi:MAG: TraY domain-containing protein [Acidobacteria bacterium]|nr:TraY domain-containing protein [Acidobacteriota bacterium]